MSVTLSLLDRPICGLSDSELLAHLDEITMAERQLAAARLQTVAELCARAVPAAHGYARPAAFLREQLKCHPGAAAQMHRLATAWPTRPELAEVAEALAKGSISEAQAAVITTAVQAITGEATAEQCTDAAALLLAQAAVLAPKELTVCGNRILHHVAPHTAEQRDRAAVEAAERNAWEARAFSLSPDGHGRVRLRGSTTAEGAALLHAILDPLTHPRRHNPSNTHASDTSAAHDTNTGNTNAANANDTNNVSAHNGNASDTNAGDANASGADASGSDATGVRDNGGEPPNAFRDPRGAAQRRHDALLDALRLLLAADILPDSGGSKPQIVVTAGLDPLTGQLRDGQLDTGAALSAAEVRRLSCDAGIIPAILDGHGVPLDLGRERRLISGGLRKALILRDRGCAWPGCDRPPRWCHGHHVRPWNAGGRTCLGNSVLLCGFHHSLLHQDAGWSVHIGPDGHAWFTAPAHLDPQQTPRRNLYHKRN